MPFQPITDIEVQTGAVIDTQLLTKIKNNLSEHETEVTAIQVAPPLVVVGTVVHSILTLAQYQSIAGPGWVLADGQSCVGSALHELTGMTNVPDARGVSLRGKDNGRGLNPDGDLALGSYQGDQFGSHNHGGGSHTHQVPTQYSGPSLNSAYANGNNNNANTGSNITTLASGTIIATQGGNETRMKNITVNIFIKIN